MATALTAREIQVECIINVYKSAHGVKPRHINFDSLSMEQLDAFLAECVAVNHRTMDDDAKVEDEAAARFEARVSEVIESGASNRETAIRWIMQSEETDDITYLEFVFNLPHCYLLRESA